MSQHPVRFATGPSRGKRVGFTGQPFEMQSCGVAFAGGVHFSSVLRW